MVTYDTVMRKRPGVNLTEIRSRLHPCAASRFDNIQYTHGIYVVHDILTRAIMSNSGKGINDKI